MLSLCHSIASWNKRLGDADVSRCFSLCRHPQVKVCQPFQYTASYSFASYMSEQWWSAQSSSWQCLSQYLSSAADIFNFEIKILNDLCWAWAVLYVFEESILCVRLAFETLKSLNATGISTQSKRGWPQELTLQTGFRTVQEFCATWYAWSIDFTSSVISNDYRNCQDCQVRMIVFIFAWSLCNVPV